MVSSETSTSSGIQERRDLGDRVLDHRDRQLGPSLGREHDPGHVLDRVAGDRDDHEPGERLRDVELVDRRLERVDEPVRHERRGRARDASSTSDSAVDMRGGAASSRWPAARTAGNGAASRVDDQDRDRSDDRDRLDVMARRVVDAVASADQDDDEVESSSSVAVSLGSRALKRIRPSPRCRAPAMITRPSTSSALTRIEPRIAVCATTSCPAFSAKITTKNSGRLPSVDCITPGDRRCRALAHLLGRERHHPRQAGQRDRGQHEGQQCRDAAGVASDARQHRRDATPPSTHRGPGQGHLPVITVSSSRYAGAQQHSSTSGSRRRGSRACASSPGGITTQSPATDLGLVLAEPHPTRPGDEVVELLASRVVVLGGLAAGRHASPRRGSGCVPASTPGPASSRIDEPSLVMNSSSSSRFAFCIPGTISRARTRRSRCRARPARRSRARWSSGSMRLSSRRPAALELEDLEHVDQVDARREREHAESRPSPASQPRW